VARHRSRASARASERASERRRARGRGAGGVARPLNILSTRSDYLHYTRRATMITIMAIRADPATRRPARPNRSTEKSWRGFAGTTIGRLRVSALLRIVSSSTRRGAPNGGRVIGLVLVCWDGTRSAGPPSSHLDKRPAPVECRGMPAPEREPEEKWEEMAGRERERERERDAARRRRRRLR